MTEHEHELVMPFVTVQSKGGPHEDAAYTAGYECGRLDAFMSFLAAPGLGGAGFTATIRAVSVPQVDLIAMRHGFSTERVEPGGDGHDWEGWATVRFEQVA